MPLNIVMVRGVRRVRRARWIAVGLMLAGFALAACVQSRATRCGDRMCPMGTSCGPSGDTCVYTDMLEACSALTDGATCTIAGLPPNKCMGGICQASRCGDGRVTGAEECDGTALGGETCQSRGFYQPSGLSCTSDCKLDTSRCVGRCGDGMKNGPEQCDGPDLGHATCFTVGYYAAPGLACKSNCTFNTGSCGGGKCGDGIINGLEQCDGAALKVADCTAAGFVGATTSLGCSKSCRYTQKSCLCTPTQRCAAKTQRCECTKTGGCGCVAVK